MGQGSPEQVVQPIPDPQLCGVALISVLNKYRIPPLQSAQIDLFTSQWTCESASTGDSGLPVQSLLLWL